MKSQAMEETSSAEIEKIDESVSSVLEEAKELQESVSNHISKTLSDEQPLRQRALALDSKIHSLRSSLDSLLHNKLINPSVADKVLLLFLSFPFQSINSIIYTLPFLLTGSAPHVSVG